MKLESKQYLALLQERADLIAEGKKLFEQADAEGIALTAEQMARDDAINARLSAIGPELERHERRRARERSTPAVLKLPRGDDENLALAHFFKTGDVSAMPASMRFEDHGVMGITLELPGVHEMQAAA